MCPCDGTVVERKPKLLWVAEEPAPPNVRQAVGNVRALSTYRPDKPLAPQLQRCPLALIYPNGSSNDTRALGRLLRELESTSTVAVFMLPPDASAAWKMLSRRKGQFVCVRNDVNGHELAAKLATLGELQPAFDNLRTELDAHAQGLPTAEQRELNEEMRLAARLQRDFLPRRLPEVGSARFSVLYKPLSWVSGDIYDVTRLDETHVGFYVADAVGHGMPAALLTMFIKKALQTKRIVGNAYQIVPPEVSLSELNVDICDQSLSACQFCTAVYGILDTETLTLTYARAGHPEPVLLHKDGTTTALEVPGSLLGIFPEEQYASAEVSLQPGDRLMFYTDGVEPALRALAGDPAASMDAAFAATASVGRDDFMLRLTSYLDSEGDSCQDDVTVLMLELADDRLPRLVRT